MLVAIFFDSLLMQKLLIIISTFIFCFKVSGQTKIFEIHPIFLEDSTRQKHLSDFKKQDSCFYQDEDYLVRKTCSGEWGGTIYFKDKKTGVEYSCQSTCPVAVYKINDKYFVTNTLGHMSGFSDVTEIDNPKNLDIFKLPKPRQKKGNIIIRAVGDDESKSTKGIKKLVDTTGILTIASFPYNQQLYYIITDFEKTFLAIIENKKFKTIDTIANESYWTYDPEVIKTTDNHYITFFDNDKAKGYLEVIGNKIYAIRYR
jgi:hypothetical protein